VDVTRKILVIDDEDEMLENCQRILEHMGHGCLTSSDSEKAINLIEQEKPNLVLTDLKMPKKDGLAVLREVHEIDRDLPVIVITGYGSIESAVEAMKAGAFDYIAKPFSLDQFQITVDRALQQINLQEENRNLKAQLQEVFQLNSIIGSSPAIHEVFETITKVAKSEANVIILGESGTGKELAARSMHINSRRAKSPFIAVDCVSLPENLLESELFGYEKGAFTGAIAAKQGLFELANRGTLFLDEIGDLGINLQAKLLRVLQERQFRRVGGTRLIDVDIRVIAATNRNLEQMVKDGEFREDLYYRLNVICIKLPPLRERVGDICILAGHFCHEFSAAQGKELQISPEALKVLEHWNWPGNVRELKNVVERAVTFAERPMVEVSDLSPYLTDEISVESAEYETALPFSEAKKKWIAVFEKKYLTDLLERHGWNISRAAREAEIDRRNIYRLIAKHGLNKNRLISEE